MDAQESIKNLKVFSKKLNSIIDVFSSENRLMPATVNAAWLDNGWSNTGSNWMDNGWNNTGSNWTDRGWSNYSNWMNDGWCDSGSYWVDSGWSNISDGGGCYITTAAVEHIGLADDCDELNTLRRYRDKLIEEDPECRKLVIEYYKIAPQIVEKISNSPDKEKILDDIYNTMVVNVLELARNGQIQEAKDYFISRYNDLKAKYIQVPQKQLVRKH